MNTLTVTFQAVVALLGIGVLGFWIIGRRQVPAASLGFLSSLAIDIALPCLVLANLLVEFSPQKFPDWWRMPLFWLGFTAVAFGLSLASSLIAKKDNRGEFAISLFFQNGLFFPLVIITGIFGKENPYLIQLFLFMCFHPSLVFSVYTVFFGKKPQVPKMNWKRIVNPVMVTTILGLTLVLVGLKPYVPEFLTTILITIGAMATPLFMLILGGNVYNDFTAKKEGEKRFDYKEVAKFVLVKNILFPLVFLGLLIWLHPDDTVAFIIILEAAVPPITAIPILTERCGGNRGITSQFIVASFIVSIISIPAVVYLFSRFFPIL